MSAGNEVHVQLNVDGNARAVQFKAARKLDIGAMEFSLSFAVIKQLAARILNVEAAAELKAQQSAILRPPNAPNA